MCLWRAERVEGVRGCLISGGRGLERVCSPLIGGIIIGWMTKAGILLVVVLVGGV